MRSKDRLIGAVALLVMLVGGIVFFLTLHANPPIAKVGAPVTVRVSVEKDGEDTDVIVPVTINRQRFHFLLDTGASTTAVNGTVLRAVGAKDTKQDEDFQDASGDTEPSRLFVVHGWSVGSMPLETDATVSDLAHPLDIDGLLGSDQLARFGRVTIDYDEQTLTTTPRKR